MENPSVKNAAEGYKKTSLPVQFVGGETFIQMDVCPQPGDTILDLGCGTGELSAYLAGLVGPSGKVIGVDPDKERIQLARQTHSQIQNLSFVEGSASNFPGSRSNSYDIIFSNQVIHWIRDKQQIFKDMYESVKVGGKLAIQYIDHELPFFSKAVDELNPENADRLRGMANVEGRPIIEQYCTSAGFDIVKSYDTESSEVVFESVESLLEWLWSSLHGVFDLTLVTEERLQKYLAPYTGPDGKPCLDFRGSKVDAADCRLIAIKQVKHSS